MIACYVRVSTKDQSHSSQTREIKQWLKANKIKPASVQWFEDKESGDHLRRDAFKSMQTEIAAGRIETVIVWHPDRIARTVFDGVITLADWIRREVRVVITTLEMDLKGAEGQLVAAVLFGVAQIEQKHRKQRQTAGIAAAKERGVYSGRKKGATKANIHKAHQLKAKGNTNKDIAAMMGIHRETVANYLKIDPEDLPQAE